MAKYSKSETEYLLHLIFCSLHNEKPKESYEVDFEALFELAKKQEIYNLINDIIQSADFVPDSVKTLFRNQSLSELNRMIAISAQREIVYSELAKNGIRYMPLKGLIFKNYYPRESMRQMSDNDILIDEAKQNEAADIMHALGYKAYDTTQNSDDFFKEPFYTFELHRTLFDDESEFSPRFENIWQNSSRDESNEFLYHMDINDVYIYSICHMYKHYVKFCCGLRFLVDNYLFIKKEGKNLNFDYINSELEKYSLSDYEKETRSLANKAFDGEELSEEEKKLLKNYTDFGLFGDSEGKVVQELSAVSDGNSKANAKARYIMRRLFPKKRDMLFIYPVLEKKPYLYPFMLIHRFFKGLFNIKKTTEELKSVNQIQKEN